MLNRKIDKEKLESMRLYFDVTGISYSEFARKIPCSVNYPGMLISGKAMPSFRMALRFEEISGGMISREIWYPRSEQ